MILKRIKIKNFRLLRDIDIDFGYRENERVNIISGLRGTGKTTFFNAISWCLLGYELYPPSSNKKISICNLKTVNLANVGDEIEVRVELEFLDNEETLIFSRGSGFFKAENRLIPKHSLDRFELIIKDGQNYISNKYPDYFIDKWLPKEVFSFFPLYPMNFLSDGLDTKRFVSSLNQTNLIEHVYKHISSMEKKYIHQQKQNHPNISMINEKINILDKKIKESEKELELAQEEVNVINDMINEMYKVIGHNIDIISLEKRHKELNHRIKIIEEQMGKTEIKLEDHILLKYPYIMSYNSFLEFIDLIDSSKRFTYIPTEVKIFIENLLDQGKCVCGTDLSIDNEHRKILEDFLKNMEAIPKSHDLEKILYHIKYVIIEDIKKFKSTSLEIHLELKKSRQIRDECIEEIKELNALFSSYPNIFEIRNLMDRKIVLSDKISNLKYSLKKDKHSLDYQKSLLMEEYEKISQSDEYQKKIDFCRKMSSAAKLLMDDFSEDFRKKLHDLTKEYFFKIDGNKNSFKDVIIHEDYQVGIMNNSGHEIRLSDLAGAEKLIYGFCFLIALENILGFEFPIFMEYPSAIFDNDMGIRFSEFLTHSLEDRQVILIIQMEMFDEIMNILQGAIGREYKVDYNYSDEGAESKVILNG